MATEELRDNFLGSYQKHVAVRKRGTNLPTNAVSIMLDGKLFALTKQYQAVNFVFLSPFRSPLGDYNMNKKQTVRMCSKSRSVNNFFIIIVYEL